MSVAGDPRWCVLVPVKRLDAAKSRLDDGDAGPDRAALALAFARDVVAAALACPVVEAVVVVTDDPRASAVLRAAGADVVGDTGRGLNEALEHAAAWAAARYPGTGTAALTADLPALRSTDLEAALVAAWPRRRTYVPDADGQGTTLLTARPGIGLNPRFGMLSSDEHFASGAAPYEPDDAPGLRRDVDTAADLEVAAALGLGPATTALLAPA